MFSRTMYRSRHSMYSLHISSWVFSLLIRNLHWATLWSVFCDAEMSMQLSTSCSPLVATRHGALLFSNLQKSWRHVLFVFFFIVVFFFVVFVSEAYSDDDDDDDDDDEWDLFSLCPASASISVSVSTDSVTENWGGWMAASMNMLITSLMLLLKGVAVRQILNEARTWETALNTILEMVRASWHSSMMKQGHLCMNRSVDTLVELLTPSRCLRRSRGSGSFRLAHLRCRLVNSLSISSSSGSATASFKMAVRASTPLFYMDITLSSL